MDREDKLREEIEDIEQGGPEKYKERLPKQGKRFVRDRLQLYFPDGPSTEFGRFANWESDDRLPADGMVTGTGELDGREVYFIANDYTVKAGSMAERGVEKFLRVQERALQARKPALYLIDSSGARITDQSGFFANRHGIGRYFYNHSLLSGVVPQVCVMYGPSVAGSAYTPVFCDFNIMVEGMSAMCIASPRMVEMVTGEQVTLEELGGPRVHAEVSGSADLVVEDEEEAVVAVRRLLSYLPDNAYEQPPRYEARPPKHDPAEMDSLIPEDPNRALDIHDIIDRVVDEGTWLELKPDHAQEMVTGLARIDGRSVGIVANNSRHKAGAIFPESSEKAAKFIWTCDAFNIPLLYLADTPGFMVGTEVEQKAILRRGRNFIYATSMATVPKLCVVVRKAYGAGIYAMAGPAFEPDSTLALPSAEIAVMGPEAAVEAVYRNHIRAIDDEEEREAFIQEKRAEYRADIDIHKLANDMVVDEIVLPSKLRDEVATRLELLEGKVQELPNRKHGTII